VRGTGQPAPGKGTLNGALAAAARTSSGITYVDLKEREVFVPYSELAAHARRLAGGLVAHGVAKGDRIALVLPTSPGFAAAFFGTLLAGAVPVPLYPPFRLGRLAEYRDATARMIGSVQASMVVTDRRIRTILGGVIELARPPLGCRTVEGLGRGGEIAGAVPDEKDLALIQFSSGSTSEPKPVALSHEKVMAQLAALRGSLPPEQGTPQLGVSWLPLYHDMGLIGCLLVAVDYPGPLVLIPPEAFLARPALWLRAISRHRGTISAAPSFAYSLCTARVRAEDLVGVELSSWRMALCGAEPISLEALHGFARRLAPFGFDAGALRCAYGLAEATLAVTLAPLGGGVQAQDTDPAEMARSGRVVPGSMSVVSVGQPVPGVEVEVRGDDGQSIADRLVGRVFVRGPAVMTGYFGQPEATAKVVSDGWLDTGDLGFTVDGELYLCGRDKDLVIIRGANHGPEEFEACAEAVDGVRPGAVVAQGFVPAPEDGEQLILLVECDCDTRDAQGDRALAESIRASVTARTAIRPHSVVLLEPGTLPRTPSGKLRRREALRLFLAGELLPERQVGPARLSLEVLRSALAFARTRGGDAR
jgi:fatty-acyl-CoA synthase